MKPRSKEPFRLIEYISTFRLEIIELSSIYSRMNDSADWLVQWLKNLVIDKISRVIIFEQKRLKRLRMSRLTIAEMQQRRSGQERCQCMQWRWSFRVAEPTRFTDDRRPHYMQLFWYILFWFFTWRKIISRMRGLPQGCHIGIPMNKPQGNCAVVVRFFLPLFKSSCHCHFNSCWCWLSHQSGSVVSILDPWSTTSRFNMGAIGHFACRW